MHAVLQHLLITEGVVRQRDHPHLASALMRARRSGELVTPLPGIFLPPQFSAATWMRAVSAWAAPHGVIHAATAASVWLGPLAGTVQLAHPTRRSRPGVVVTRRLIPRAFVSTVEGTQLATPGYAAVELAGTDDGRALCEALRQRLVRTDELPCLLESLAGCIHQQQRRKVVEAAMQNPWSFGELRLHQILTTARITGWVANQPLRCGGSTMIPDVRFRAVKLVLEFDGRATHEQRFLADRERQNRLEAAGFRVIRFGWEHLDQPDYIVATVRTALRAT